MIIAFLLVLALLGMLLSKARNTHWTLLEGLVVTAILGHVIVLPIIEFIKRHDYDRCVAAGVLSSTVALAMAYGMISVLRDLNTVNERRAGMRLINLILGLLLIPSFLAFPWNIVLGWIVWLPWYRLHRHAESMRSMLSAEQAEAQLHRIWRTAPPKPENVVSGGTER
jgi:hypothetical protein